MPTGRVRARVATTPISPGRALFSVPTRGHIRRHSADQADPLALSGADYWVPQVGSGQAISRFLRITSICRAFGQHPPGSARPECPGIAGDYRELAPDNAASGTNVGAESGSPAAYRGPDYLELIALVPAQPGVPPPPRGCRCPGAFHGAPPPLLLSTRSRSDRRRRRAMHSRSSLAERPAAPPDRHCGTAIAGPPLRGRRAIAEQPSASLSGRLLRETEGGEHSSTELTISVKVPCQECGGRGYVETVNEGPTSWRPDAGMPYLWR
jgi:hypothetical protein